MNSERVFTDVLVIGSGIAGCVAALTVAEDPELRVTVITGAEDPHESNTYYAQGGIIGRGPHDSAELLMEDILRAGDYVNNRAAVAILAEEGPRLVQELLVERLGVPFAGASYEEPEYIREAAHSTERILHVADATGRAIEEKLIAAVKSTPNITLLTRHTAVDLLTPAHHSRDPLAIYEPLSCVGAYVFDQREGRVRAYLARKTILASGGLGRIYLHTTNPERARGDGLAMAYRAGARIINAQYVQFHPTAFYRREAPRFLISEAVRGAGARLVDANGRPFMHKYAPEWKDLAPRDVVARSIHREMLETKAERVYLDLRSYMPADEIRSRFPTIYARCKEYGVAPVTSSRWCRRPITSAAAYGWTSGDAPPCAICTPSVRFRAPACTGPTGWAALPCWRGWCGAIGQLRMSAGAWPRKGPSWTSIPRTSRPGMTRGWWRWPTRR